MLGKQDSLRVRSRTGIPRRGPTCKTAAVRLGLSARVERASVRIITPVHPFTLALKFVANQKILAGQGATQGKWERAPDPSTCYASCGRLKVGSVPYVRPVLWILANPKRHEHPSQHRKSHWRHGAEEFFSLKSQSNGRVGKSTRTFRRS